MGKACLHGVLVGPGSSSSLEGYCCRANYISGSVACELEICPTPEEFKKMLTSFTGVGVAGDRLC